MINEDSFCIYLQIFVFFSLASFLLRLYRTQGAKYSMNQPNSIAYMWPFNFLFLRCFFFFALIFFDDVFEFVVIRKMSLKNVICDKSTVERNKETQRKKMKRSKKRIKFKHYMILRIYQSSEYTMQSPQNRKRTVRAKYLKNTRRLKMIVTTVLWQTNHVTEKVPENNKMNSDWRTEKKKEIWIVAPWSECDVRCTHGKQRVNALLVCHRFGRSPDMMTMTNRLFSTIGSFFTFPHL